MAAPLMMSLKEFADLHGISETTARACMKGESDTYPPLMVKRVRRPGSTRSFLYVTAEQAQAWREALPDA